MSDARAGQPAQPSDLIDVAALVTAYYTLEPDPADPAQQVVFGTSGHRGSSFDAAFNEAHILATTQAICEYRAEQGYDGPLFVGRDTHGLSEPAWATALEVLAANDVTVLVDADDRYTPTPAVSHAILAANRGKTTASPTASSSRPSHNPPRDGGFKYNPPNGGPADTDATGASPPGPTTCCGPVSAASAGSRSSRPGPPTAPYDFIGTYVDDLPSVVDIDAIRDAGVRIGADPLGGASVDYWGAIAERHRIDLTVVNPAVDPTWRFMTLDWDGKIRMDCSSPCGHGLAGPPQGRVPDRHGQRRRRRPARHRHARRGPDEPEPLPRRRDRLSAQPPPRAGRRTPPSARRWSPAR